jgi:hypothetical protein
MSQKASSKESRFKFPSKNIEMERDVSFAYGRGGGGEGMYPSGIGREGKSDSWLVSKQKKSRSGGTEGMFGANKLPIVGILSGAAEKQSRSSPSRRLAAISF